MTKIVKGSWTFKADAGDKLIRDFLQDYINGGYLVLHDIKPCNVIDADGTVTGESILVAEFYTDESNLKQFQKEFGKYSTIREGWA